jgi:hypothetical protein
MNGNAGSNNESESQAKENVTTTRGTAMRIMLKRPNEKPVEMDCKPGEGYSEWRDLIQGWVEHAPYDDGVDMYFDEEGKLKNLPPNFAHPRHGQIVGTVIFAARRRIRKGTLTEQVIPASLSNAQIERIVAEWEK